MLKESLFFSNEALQPYGTEGFGREEKALTVDSQ